MEDNNIISMSKSSTKQNGTTSELINDTSFLKKELVKNGISLKKENAYLSSTSSLAVSPKGVNSISSNTWKSATKDIKNKENYSNSLAKIFLN